MWCVSILKLMLYDYVLLFCLRLRALSLCKSSGVDDSAYNNGMCLMHGRLIQYKLYNHNYNSYYIVHLQYPVYLYVLFSSVSNSLANSSCLISLNSSIIVAQVIGILLVAPDNHMSSTSRQASSSCRRELVRISFTLASVSSAGAVGFNCK